MSRNIDNARPLSSPVKLAFITKAERPLRLGRHHLLAPVVEVSSRPLVQEIEVAMLRLQKSGLRRKFTLRPHFSRLKQLQRCVRSECQQSRLRMQHRRPMSKVVCGWLLHCKSFLAISAVAFVSTVVCPACLCGGVPLALMNSASEVPIGLST